MSIRTRPPAAPPSDVRFRASANGRSGHPGWVLVTDGADGQSRSALAAVRALAVGGFQVAVTVPPGRPSLAAASRHCHRRVVVPSLDRAGYAEAVGAHRRAWPYAAVLAASDAALHALDEPGAVLTDKLVVEARSRAAGLAVPASRRFATVADLRAAAGELDYPVVVKPVARTARHGLPAVAVEGPAGLAAIPAGGGAVLVQSRVHGPLRAVAGVIRDGSYVAVVHQRAVRTWPPGCGVASAAQTVEPDLDLEGRLLDVLAGYDGVFQVQLVGDAVVDVNPRVYGSLPLAVAAGVNLPALWCRGTRAGSRPQRARVGVAYRWLEGDLRAVAHRVRSGALTPAGALGALRPGRGTAYSVEALSDPGPLLARLAHVSRRRRWA